MRLIFLNVCFSFFRISVDYGYSVKHRLLQCLHLGDRARGCGKTKKKIVRRRQRSCALPDQSSVSAVEPSQQPHRKN